MKMEKDMVERALLCSLFLNEAAILEVIAVLRPEMFRDQNYGFVYEVFTEIFNSGRQPDMILVDLEMKKKDFDRSSKMGGISYIADGLDEVRLEHNVIAYAIEIRRLYMLACLQKLFMKKMLESQQFDSDYQVVMEECEKALLDLRADNAETDPLKPLYQVAQETIEYQLMRMNNERDPVRMLTGVAGIDGLTGGLYRKEMLVMGGLPSDGKTALSSFIAMNLALNGYHVLHFSFEMTGVQTIARFNTGYAQVESERQRIGGLREQDLKKMKDYAERLKKLPYYFTNISSVTMEALRAQVMLRKRKGQCDMVLIDYLHMLAPAQKRGETPEAVIRATIIQLSSIAKEANCAMLVVSQLNRDVLKRADKGFIPQMNDLRDSGAIEFVADSVVILNRPWRFDLKTDKNGRSTEMLINLYMLKNRNGTTGVGEVYRNETYTYFTNPGGILPFVN